MCENGHRYNLPRKSYAGDLYDGWLRNPKFGWKDVRGGKKGRAEKDWVAQRDVRRGFQGNFFQFFFFFGLEREE